jgi:hypothetical protein
MANLSSLKRRAIRKSDVAYQCLIEDLVDLDVLPGWVANKLLQECPGHKHYPEEPKHEPHGDA